MIFLTLCKEYPSARAFLFEISNGYNIDELYRNLRSVDEYKTQRALMIDFIDWVKSTSGKEDGNVDHSGDERKRQEKREAILKRQMRD